MAGGRARRLGASQRFRDLIRIKRPSSLIEDNGFNLREVIMSFDAMLVSAAVVFVFVVFAGVLMWGDFQTRPPRQKAVPQSQKR